MYIYILRTSYFGESHGPVYCVFEKKLLHRRSSSVYQES